MDKSLGIKSSTVTAFLNDKLTPAQIEELQKIMNLDPKLYRSVRLSWLIWTWSKTNLNPIQIKHMIK